MCAVLDPVELVCRLVHNLGPGEQPMSSYYQGHEFENKTPFMNIMRSYSAKPGTVPGGYPEYPDPLGGDFQQINHEWPWSLILIRPAGWLVESNTPAW